MIFVGSIVVIQKLKAENLDLKRKRKAFLPKAKMLNSSEQYLFHTLNDFCVNSNHYVLSQVHLASIIMVSEKAEDYYETLTDLDKSIDFVLMDKETTKPVLLIEYNGPEHTRPNRKVRDNFLENLLNDCQIPFLILLPSQIQNKDELKRIIDRSINKSIQMQQST